MDNNNNIHEDIVDALPVKLDNWTRRKFMFLNALLLQGQVTIACTMSGLSKSWVYTLRERDQWFMDSWEDALEAHADISLHRVGLLANESGDSNRMLKYYYAFTESLENRRQRAPAVKRPKGELIIDMSKLEPAEQVRLTKLLRKAVEPEYE